MPSPEHKYRFDLDGLRGLVIAGVVVFHVYVGRVSGGVDVFLLLSGFFFLGSQLRNVARPTQSINPWWSIWRTARRLLPGLLTVLAATTLAVIFFVPEFRHYDMAKQLTASVLYFQNYELARQGADYNVASNLTSPLQHLWSMSAQGQFYLGAILLVSLLAWWIRRRTKDETALQQRINGSALWVLSVVAIASFAWACYLHIQNQGWNYYSTVSRLWELTLGGVLAITVSKISLSTGIRRILAPVGLALIISTGFILDGAANFPGPWTLWPIMGAVFVIIGGATPGFTTALLRSRPMRGLGDIAYSLYLWHWPLLILATTYFEQETPSATLGTSVIATSLVLAWLTNRFVEKPLLQRGKRPALTDHVVANAVAGIRTSTPAKWRAVGGVLCGIALIALVGIQGSLSTQIEKNTDGIVDNRLYPGARALMNGKHALATVPDVPKFQTNPLFIGQVLPRPFADSCMSVTSRDPEKLIMHKKGLSSAPCIYGDVDSEKKIVLIGGSHSEHWFPALDIAAQELGYQLQVLVRQGCPATLSRVDGVVDMESCLVYNNTVMDYLAEEHPVAVVTTTTRPGSEFTDYTPDGYSRYFDKISDLGIGIIGIRDNPWPHDINGLEYAPTACIDDDWEEGTMPLLDEEKDEYGKARNSHGGNAPTKCDFPRWLTLSPENEGDYVLDALPNTLSLDFSDVFCDEYRCPAVIGNLFVYRDYHHMSVAFARSLGAEMTDRTREYLSNQ